MEARRAAPRSPANAPTTTPAPTPPQLFSLGTRGEPLSGACVEAAPCYFTPRTLALMGACYFLLMPAASFLPIPGGQFLPSLVVGACLGALAGFGLR